MSPLRASVLALVVALVAPQAFAQDLDIPLPSSGSPKKPKVGKSRTSKKATAKKPAPAPTPAAPDDFDLDVPLPSQKPATAKKPEPAEEVDLDVPLPSKKPATAKKPALAPDDELIPTVKRSELVVKLAGGIKGARLFVDNKDMGTLPLSAPLQVDAGEHSLLVRRPGFADFSRRVTAQRGKPTEVAVTLEAVAGVVTVTSDVPGASVTINGQPRGQVPLNGVVLKPGNHEIIVSKEGFQPDQRTVAVKAGKDQPVVANLKPVEVSQPVASTDRPQNPVLEPTPPAVINPSPLTQEVPQVAASQPWFKRWYVWAGVGVVAAAAAGAVVATQGGAKPLSPSDVCGGTCDGTINGIGMVRLGGR
jgi:hypothetical protein